MVADADDDRVSTGRSLLRDVGPAAFRFLVDEYGLQGPDISTPLVGQGDTLVYRRPGLTVAVEAWWWNNERGFDTTLTLTDDDGATVAAGLDLVYEACALGPASDVPGGHSGAGRTTHKRIEQHAWALRAVMPTVAGPDAAIVFRRARARR